MFDAKLLQLFLIYEKFISFCRAQSWINNLLIKKVHRLCIHWILRSFFFYCINFKMLTLKLYRGSSLNHLKENVTIIYHAAESLKFFFEDPSLKIHETFRAFLCIFSRNSSPSTNFQEKHCQVQRVSGSSN